MFQEFKTIMNLLKKLLVFAIIFASTASFGQEQDFSLQVVKTDETCPGNGSLTFNIFNAIPGASVLYKIYLLPNTASPISIQQAEYISSLASGNYRVEAIQTFGQQQNVAVQDITIDNAVPFFDFSVTSANEICAGGGTIVCTATAGEIIQYEIVSGPETRVAQASGRFHNLPQGVYNVRAFDACGTAKVKTYTLLLYEGVLEISDAYYPEDISDNCNYITINNKIKPTAGTIPYPVTVEHTFDIMDLQGNPLQFVQTYETGSPTELVVSVDVPRENAGYGSYSLKVSDYCNAVYEKDNIVIDNNISLSLTTAVADCYENYLIVTAGKVAVPYTLTFLSAPQGFVPGNFNAAANGPVMQTSLQFGNESNTIPHGVYVVKIVDACGRSITKQVNVENNAPEPEVVSYNGCLDNTGHVKIRIKDNIIASVAILSAPSGYPHALPHDVSAGINEQGMFVLRNLPVGNYTLKITDSCGNIQVIDVLIEIFRYREFTMLTKPGCAIGYGTVYSESGNDQLESMFITSAPPAFGQQLPFDVSDHIIWNGDMYMGELPQGQYVFVATDVCGVQKTMSVYVEGYQVPQPQFVFHPQCNAFSVVVTDASNGVSDSNYWLQKYNPSTAKWVHPVTGVPYTEGSLPTPATGIKLYKNQEKVNLRYTGKFRILKKFEAYGDATSVNSVCISSLGEFIYGEEFSVKHAYTLECVGQPNSVYVEVTGNPVAYKIIEKNGQPYIIHNGLNNVFTDLEPAEYTFSVEDFCGNIIVKKFNLVDLPSIADATTPADMIMCGEQGSTATTGVFRLKDQDAAILGALHSASYTITYHLTQADADSGVNALPEYYTSQYNGQTIYARLVHNDIGLCYGTTSFKLFTAPNFEVHITANGSLCQGEALYLTASAGFDEYRWSTGETTRSILITQPGHYSVTVPQGYGSRTCNGYAEIEITQSAAPHIVSIQTQDWTDDQNMISIIATGMGNLLYSIDGENWQESNVFTGLENGFYTVFVKDAGGCGIESKEAVLLNYPKFFTPNGDGINDTWRIRYSSKEPNMKIHIFDRFGKVVASFGPNHEGWDGTFNGHRLPSTDYWFVVVREDGRELKGHFAMIR